MPTKRGWIHGESAPGIAAIFPCASQTWHRTDSQHCAQLAAADKCLRPAAETATLTCLCTPRRACVCGPARPSSNSFFDSPIAAARSIPQALLARTARWGEHYEAPYSDAAIYSGGLPVPAAMKNTLRQRWALLASFPPGPCSGRRGRRAMPRGMKNPAVHSNTLHCATDRRRILVGTYSGRLSRICIRAVAFVKSLGPASPYTRHRPLCRP